MSGMRRKADMVCRNPDVRRAGRAAPSSRDMTPTARRLTFDREAGLNGRHKPETAAKQEEGENRMKAWKRPVIVEIQVGMEINLYVCAEL
jgi:coenzyme PQQ precursor peptide PqqA